MNNSLKVEHYKKLDRNFCGPYTTLKKVGHVAYQLALPIHSNIHHVFHGSLLKKMIGTKYQTKMSILELEEEGSIWL